MIFSLRPSVGCYFMLFSLTLVLSCSKPPEEEKELALTPEPAELFLHTATLSSGILNSPSSNFEYGFVYSKKNDKPETGGSDNLKKFGESKGSISSFDVEVSGLEWGKSYKFRPYIKHDDKILYGAVVGATVSERPRVEKISPKSPANQELSKFKQKFEWKLPTSHGTYGFYYKLYVGRSKDRLVAQEVAESINNKERIEGASFQSEGLKLSSDGELSQVDYGEKIYWTVEACYGNQVCVREDVDSVLVYKKIDGVLLTSSQGDNSIKVSWNNPSKHSNGNQLRYKVRLRKSEGQKIRVVSESSKGKTQTISKGELDIYGIGAGKDFLAQVQAFNEEDIQVSESDWATYRYN